MSKKEQRMHVLQIVKNGVVIAEKEGWATSEMGFPHIIHKNTPCMLNYIEDGEVYRRIVYRSHKDARDGGAE